LQTKDHVAAPPDPEQPLEFQEVTSFRVRIAVTEVKNFAYLKPRAAGCAGHHAGRLEAAFRSRRFGVEHFVRSLQHHRTKEKAKSDTRFEL
jgi:hypothetical protein